MSQGVLEALKFTELANGRTMLDEVDMISSVSDGYPEFVAMARAVSGCEVLQQDMLTMAAC